MGTSRDLDVNSEASSDEEEGLPSGGGGQMLPFGSVVAASGRSVRVTTSCSAGLAARLPM